MPSENDGVMIVLSSPSGAGKTTLVQMLSEKDNYETSISHTTRQPRPNEVNDKDYYFVNENEFNRLIKNQEFLEYAKVFSNFYGTTRTPVIDKLNKGKNVLFDIDWQGADQIKNKKLDYKLITFFILPPSKEVLFERLSNRDMKDKLIAEERMKQFGRDVLHWINYDYVVFSQHNSLPNLPKVIERVVLEKKAIVLLVNRTLNIGHFYNVMNDNRFHIINEQSLEQELILTINIASKYNGLIQNLSNDNLKLKSRVNLLENTNKAKRILISKGLSEAESHNFIQKKAMDMRISKNEMVSLIIENKIDI